MIIELEQEMYKMSLEYLTAPESKKVLKKPTMMGMSKAQESTGAAPNGQSCNNLSNQIK